MGKRGLSQLRASAALICVWLSCTLGCAPSDAPLLVLGAASLTDALRQVGQSFAAVDPRGVHFSFSGSQMVAIQLREQVRADVIAVADSKVSNALYGEHLIDLPEVFATNRLVWIAPSHNGGPRLRPPDLARRGRLVLAAASVPSGRYARQALAKMGLLEAAEGRIVSRELDVRGVLGKVLLSGADAGIVYATDTVGVDRSDYWVQELPREAQPTIAYTVAVARASNNRERARAFATFLLSEPGQDALRRWGFGEP